MTPEQEDNAAQTLEREMRGFVVRLDMISTHYRAPKDFTAENLNRSAKQLRRWLSIAIPTDDAPPQQVIDVLCDDLNTVAAIAEIHKLAKAGDGKAVFASLQLLGLLPDWFNHLSAENFPLPIMSIPLPQWDQFNKTKEKSW